MPLTQKILGERLKEARNQVQMKQEDAAKALEMERTVLGKIESGSRSVSGLELDRLARLYRRDVRELLSEEPLREDPLLILGRTVAPELLNSDRVARAIDLIRQAAQIETLIGEPVWANPPGYDFPEPRSTREADEHGREMARLERQRLGLGKGPIAHIADLVASQGIWTGAFEFPAEISGLFMADPEFGLMILVNCDNAKGRRRFSYAHEYAHALADRNRSSVASTTHNAKDYIERRANVFASEFLVPLEGVHEYLDRFRKGLKSRVNLSYWDAAFNKGEVVEDRVQPGSQKLTCLEAWYIASEFKVSYEMAVYRLKRAGAIKESEIEELKSQQGLAKFMVREFHLNDVERPQVPDPFDSQPPELKMQVARLLLEAYRRGVIYTSKFREMCELADLNFDDLYPVAKSAREALVGD